MVATPISGTAPYCTTAQFVQLCDWRQVAQFLSDTGTQATREDLLDPTTTVGATLVTLLQMASGEVEARILKGGRYQVADLQVLVGTNSGLFLAKLVGNIASWTVLGRRWIADRPIPLQYTEATKHMELLGNGENILGLQETANAGTIGEKQEVSTNVIQRDLTTWQARRMFGNRSNVLADRGG